MSVVNFKSFKLCVARAHTFKVLNFKARAKNIPNYH